MTQNVDRTTPEGLPTPFWLRSLAAVALDKRKKPDGIRGRAFFVRARNPWSVTLL